MRFLGAQTAREQLINADHVLGGHAEVVTLGAAIVVATPRLGMERVGVCV